ncbi:hypothetical protein DCAR_0934783 [Daucus carota subsp. sativus]|uniref:Protein DA1-like domain-containing protein n=1 Tax=Daucus carota subsp. sativus TaxID=79200 RepID=A0A175YJZ0_DAUCS|nr:hypothetical protein DCAR_0934783 [Daucus carota subsp. sativus]
MLIVYVFPRLALGAIVAREMMHSWMRIEGKNSKRISEGSKNFSEAVKNNIMASGASDAGQRKTADVGWENNLKGNAVINEACTTEEETYSMSLVEAEHS